MNEEFSFWREEIDAISSVVSHVVCRVFCVIDRSLPIVVLLWREYLRLSVVMQWNRFWRKRILNTRFWMLLLSQRSAVFCSISLVVWQCEFGKEWDVEMPPSLNRDKIYRGNVIWDPGIRFGVFPTKQRTEVLLHRNRRRASSPPNSSIVWTNGERSVQSPSEPSFEDSLSRLNSPHRFHRSLSTQFLPHFPFPRSYSVRNPLSPPSRLEFDESKWHKWHEWH